MAARTKRGALIAGLILISIGVIFFIENWYAGFSAWRLVSRYWPLIFIIIGLNKLYGYFTWEEVAARQADAAVDASLRAAGVSGRPSRSRRPSLMGGLLWTGFGVLFLLRNFGIGPDFWRLAVRYWPILLILIGLGKVIDYFRQKEGVSLRFGEVFGILFIFLLGAAFSRIANSSFGQLLEDLPVRIGDAEIRPAQWLDSSYTYSQEVAYPINPATPLRIENSHGFVSLSPGSDNEVRVRLRKVVFHRKDEEARAKEIGNEIKLEGGVVGKVEAEAIVKAEAEAPGKSKGAPFLIRTNREDLSSKNYRFDTEMELVVPKKSQIQVINSYGEIRAAGLEGRLDLATTHNALDVRDCSGEFVISNKYAESRLVNLKGNVIVDARGRVYVETVRGEVNIRNEYSPVEIKDVDGKVTVSNTESSIQLEKVTKPVMIDARGSYVTVRDLESSLKVTTSHRQVKISGVASDVSVECRYANATLKDIRGNVDVDSISDRLIFEDIRGSLKVKAQGSSVQANSIGGAVDISTTMKSVNVNNFEAGCKVSGEYADITLSTGTLVKGEVVVKNRNGEIQLFLPEDASFALTATARNGQVDSDFPGLVPASTSGDSSTLQGKLKTGAAKIALETEYSNIHVRTRGADNAGDTSREKRRKGSTI
jgi:hypothetical protein